MINEEKATVGVQFFLSKLANGEQGGEEQYPNRALSQAEKKTVKQFFVSHPNPSDDQVHELAESMQVSPHALEEYVYSLVGKTAQKHEHVPDEQFDQEQLRMGIEVEKEHTDDPEKAKEIAKDHLSEFSDYYTRLKKMEEKAKEAYYVEAYKVAADLMEDAYVDEHMKLAGYTEEEIQKLRDIYSRAREIRRQQEKPTEGLEEFMEGGPRLERPVNPLSLGDAHRWPRPYGADVADEDKIKPYKDLVNKEMAIHKGKDRDDISNAVRWVRETSFMNSPPPIPSKPGK